jgi:glyoxylase-like metal-dependent hydrolase (beta-lactamase superfamily II)
VDDYYDRAVPLARSVEPTGYLKEGDRFQLSSLEFTVTAVPGHTPFCILIHDTENTFGFSGDFLQGVTTSPLTQRNTDALQPYNSLKSYVSSLQKVRAMGLRVALPGHGEIIEDVSKNAGDILNVIEQRRDAIIHILEVSRCTVVEIAHKLFPDLLPGRLFNAVSEVTAHLEVLEEDRLLTKVGNQPPRFCLRPA